jgi:hypothetical protein
MAEASAAAATSERRLTHRRVTSETGPATFLETVTRMLVLLIVLTILAALFLLGYLSGLDWWN